MKPLHQAKWQAAAFALAAVVLLAYLYGSLLLDQEAHPAGAPVKHFDAAAIPLGEAHDVALDRADGTVRVTGPNPCLLTELNDRHLALLLSLGLAILFDLFAGGPVLAAAVWRRPGWAAVLLAVLVAHFLFAALSSALIMYVAETAPAAALIRGFQLRYLFPVIIPFFFVPLALLEGKKEEAGQAAAPAEPGTPLLNSAALCLLPLLLFARQVELTANLLIRYW